MFSAMIKNLQFTYNTGPKHLDTLIPILKNFLIKLDIKSLKRNYNFSTLSKLLRSRWQPSQVRNASQNYKNIVNFTSIKGLNSKHENFSWRKSTSFYNPLMYYIYYLDLIDVEYTNFFLKLFILLEPFILSIPSILLDDLLRQVFIFLSSLLLQNTYDERCFNKYTPLVSLETVGGPSSYTDDGIIEQVKEWVTGTTNWGQDADFVDDRLTYYVNKWVDQANVDALSFDEYVTDVYKWGTSGGTYKVELEDYGAVRSKWAWGVQNLFEGKDPYKESLKKETTARVALKEEVKTRAIISTPMSSYLRQNFINDTLGKMAGFKSTLMDRHITEKFFSKLNRYACIDASKFDYQIPKSFITSFFDKIYRRCLEWYNGTGNIVFRDLYTAAFDEMKSLEQLEVKVFDVNLKYEKGLLSGWKMTSLIGSLASAIVVDYVNDQLGTNMDYIVQGDDIIIALQANATKENVLNAIKNFGLIINEKKSTFGTIGEFLKYRYHPNLIYAVPARAVRAIFYANVWSNPTKLNMIEKIHQTVNSHMILLSRLNVTTGVNNISKSLIDQLIRDILRIVNSRSANVKGKKFTLNYKQVAELLQVPMNAGGFGVFETMDKNRLIDMVSNANSDATIPYIDFKFVTPFTDPYTTFLNYFGIQPTSKKLDSKLFPVPVLKYMKYTNQKIKIQNLIDNLQSGFKSVISNVPRESLASPRSYRNINKYATLLAILVGKTKNKVFQTALNATRGPRYDFSIYKSNIKWLSGSFFRVLQHFQASLNEISPPDSLFYNTRYHAFPQARMVSEFMNVTLKNKIDFRYRYIFANVINNIFRDHFTFFHSL